MKAKLIAVAVSGLVLTGCSSLNPFSDSRMVSVDRLDPKDAAKVPKYFVEAQEPNRGVGEGRASNLQSSKDLARHHALVDLACKQNIDVKSQTNSTAAQNSKGGSSLTANTATVTSTSKCAALIRSTEDINLDIVQYGNEFRTYNRVRSDSVEQPVQNQFTEADQKQAERLRSSQ